MAETIQYIGAMLASKLGGPIEKYAITQLMGMNINMNPKVVTAYGAKGDGVTDDTSAIQQAVTACGDNGVVIFPEGTYKISGITISGDNIKLMGVGSCSLLERLSDATGTMIAVSGAAFSMEGLKVQEAASTYTNTGALLKTSSVSDVRITNCWFNFGYDQIYCDISDNVIITNCILEAARRSGIYGNQLSLSNINTNCFFAHGLDSSNALASIYIQKDSGYSFKANNDNIVGNYFFYARYGHFIALKEVKGAQIVGNFFGLAGMYNSGTKDDINLDDCEYVSITGNTSNLVYNSYIGSDRASRYCINADAGCSKITVTGNTLEAGVTGTINDLSSDGMVKIGNVYSAATMRDDIGLLTTSDLGIGTASPISGILLDVRGTNAKAQVGSGTTTVFASGQCGWGANNGTEKAIFGVQSGATFAGANSNNDLLLLANNTGYVKIRKEGFINIPSLTALPTYANNAAAVTGGLGAGDLYRTGGDPDAVCVVH